MHVLLYSIIPPNKWINKKYLEHKHYVPIKASTDVNISKFFFIEKWGDEAVDHEKDLWFDLIFKIEIVLSILVF